jgi:DNA-binding transcriptional MerR regulator
MPAIKEIRKYLDTYLKRDVARLLIEVLRQVAKAEKEIRKLQKEGPMVFRRRIHQIIEQLETLAKDGEKKVDSLIGHKLNPVLDLVEQWLSTKLKTKSKSSSRKSTRNAKRGIRSRVPLGRKKRK